MDQHSIMAMFDAVLFYLGGLICAAGIGAHLIVWWRLVIYLKARKWEAVALCVGLIVFSALVCAVGIMGIGISRLPLPR